MKYFLASIIALGILCNLHAQTVYITKTGAKYHTSTCSYLKSGGVPKELSEIKNTYSPCSRCYSKGQSTKKTSSSETPTSTTPTGKTIYTGPRGGQYHYSKSGKKVYERKRK